MADATIDPPAATQTVAEVRPPQARKAVPPDTSKDGDVKSKSPGIIRYHPVHGRVEFEDANEHAANGGDDGDFRFKTAFEADAARTDAEARIVEQHNLNAKLKHHEDRGIVRNSVAAQESFDAGNAEPDMPRLKDDE